MQDIAALRLQLTGGPRTGVFARHGRGRRLARHESETISIDNYHRNCWWAEISVANTLPRMGSRNPNDVSHRTEIRSRSVEYGVDGTMCVFLLRPSPDQINYAKHRTPSQGGLSSLGHHTIGSLTGYHLENESGSPFVLVVRRSILWLARSPIW